MPRERAREEARLNTTCFSRSSRPAARATCGRDARSGRKASARRNGRCLARPLPPAARAASDDPLRYRAAAARAARRRSARSAIADAGGRRRRRDRRARCAADIRCATNPRRAGRDPGMAGARSARGVPRARIEPECEALIRARRRGDGCADWRRGGGGGDGGGGEAPRRRPTWSSSTPSATPRSAARALSPRDPRNFARILWRRLSRCALLASRRSPRRLLASRRLSLLAQRPSPPRRPTLPASPPAASRARRRPVLAARRRLARGEGARHRQPGRRSSGADRDAAILERPPGVSASSST